MVHRHVQARILVYLYHRFGGTCGFLLHEAKGCGFLQNIDTSTKSHGFTPPNTKFISDMALDLYVGSI